MLRICVLVLCGVFFAHGRLGVGPFRKFQKPNGPSPVIIGGSYANYNDYPWTVSLQYNSATLGWGHFCGGSLYRSRYVITTAHCIENKPAENMRAIVGAIYLEGDVNGQTEAITSYITHPDYDISTGLPNDIAIMTLVNPIITSTAQNANLPPDDNNLFIQSTCYLTGWGHTSPIGSTVSPILKVVQTPVISNGDCASDLSGYDNAAVFDTHICARSLNLDSGACEADTGSPLTCCWPEAECTTEYVVGVASYFMIISGECSTRDPTVYVRISKFLDWINVNTP